MQKIINFTIIGQPYVKKSNQRTVWNGKRIVRIDTPRYRQWHASAVTQLMVLNKPIAPIKEPIILEIHFYLQTRRRVDLSNLYEGIQDVLVEMAVLEDDNYTIVAGHDGSRAHYDKENPRMEVTLWRI